RDFWESVSAADLESSLRLSWNNRRARNVVLFVGDGLGPNTITAARIYRAGEHTKLALETLPHMGLLKTYSANKQVPDSASTATAMFCGVKTNYEVIGLDESVQLRDCPSSLSDRARLTSIVDWAQQAGKGTGFVTTTRVTHATPAALYAHSADRKWECDMTMPDNATICQDIATQLVQESPGKYMQVIMGGGRQCLKSDVEDLENDPVDKWACLRQDGKDLIKDWSLRRLANGNTFQVADKTEHLDNLDYDNIEYLLGIFANSHLSYEYSRDKGPRGMPSLEQMTLSAIRVLLKQRNGFVLIVEGGLIDVAHHRCNARKALQETLAFDQAINSSLRLLADQGILDDTLVIVTSDHAHTLTINGYPERGNNILGISQVSKLDGVPYTTLSYSTSGPNGYHFRPSQDGTSVVREDPSKVDTTHWEYAQQSAILTDENTHGGSDVLVYATGPKAHLFHSLHEQNYVAAVISYAAQIGKYAKRNARMASHAIYQGPPSVVISCIIFYSIINFWKSM
ncbi:hypothetical protein AAG570_002235, partial [Ranatra chinensis]